MPLVSERQKQEDLVSLVEAAAERYKSGLTIETHHRLANEPGVVSRRRRNEVMGTPNYYCEVLPIGAPTERTLASGSTSSVAHTFNVFLVLEYEEHDQYGGSTQQTFQEVTEGRDPSGVLPVLRNASVREVGDFRVTYQGPTSVNKNIIPLGESGGGFDRGHRLEFEITLIEPN